VSGHVLSYVPKSIAHRWITVLITFILVVGAWLPVIWLLVEPYCVVKGAIHVAPSLPNILTGEPDGQISDYGSYMNTQAIRLTSGAILEDVADDVARRSLAFFTPDRPVGMITRLEQKLGLQPIPEGPVDTLKAAIVAGTISAEPIPHSEYIGITMKYPDEPEAKVIVNSFLQQFENTYGVQAKRDANMTLRQLTDQEEELAKKIQRQQDELQRIARAHGTTASDSQQEMAQRRQKTLAAELTRLEIERLHLEAKVAALERGGDNNVPADELAAARKQYTSSDPMVKELVENIVEMKLDLIVAEPNLAPGDPEILRRQERLAAFEATLEKKEKELAAEFDELIRTRARHRPKHRLASAKAELQQIQANEDQLREVLSEQERKPRQVAVASADLQRLQLDLDLDRKLYEQIVRRKRETEMQLDRRGRVSIAHLAELESTVDSRAKLSGIMCLAGLFAAMVLAVARGPRQAKR